MQDSPHTSPFDAIRKVADDGSEYWSARELYKLLGYSRWEKFQKSIEEAKIACENSNQAVADHFHLEVQSIKSGKGARRPIEDYRLSRPEYLPTPDKSIQKLQRTEQQRLKQGQQSPLLDNPDEGW